MYIDFRNRWFLILNNTLQIRELYTPVQPAVRLSGDEVSYRECWPEHGLLSYVYCYWELRSHQSNKDTPFFYRVVADGCTDVFFPLHNSSESFVMGFSNRFTAFSLEEDFHYIGIRFLPGMFTHISGVGGNTLANRSVELMSVMPSLSGFISRYISPEKNFTAITKLFDRFLFDRICDLRSAVDTRFKAALIQILSCQGAAALEKGLDTGVSSRHLRRLFDFYIGDTPKSFSRVVRFQHALKWGFSEEMQDEKAAIFDAGYYDQAHFIRDFSNFYGLTPGKIYGK